MFKKVALLSALALSSGIVMAEGNWYIGAGLGQASVNFDGLKDEFSSSVSISIDDSDTSYKLFGGYKFNRNFAIEAGYADFGQYKARGNGPTYIGQGKMDSSAFFVDAVGILPLNDSFSLFGKGGLAYAHAKTKVAESYGTFSFSDSGRDDEFVPKLGIGAEYNITKSFAVRAEYEHYFNVGDQIKTWVESDIGVWAISAKMSF